MLPVSFVGIPSQPGSKYYSDTHAVCFVVDAADPERFAEVQASFGVDGLPCGGVGDHQKCATTGNRGTQRPIFPSTATPASAVGVNSSPSLLP